MTRRPTSSATKVSSKLNRHVPTAPGLLLAASAGAGGHLAAMAADSPATAAAIRTACAEAAAAEDREARPRSEGAAPRPLQGQQRNADFDLRVGHGEITAASSKTKSAKDTIIGSHASGKEHDAGLPEMYPTDVPLPDDPGIFVDEIHEVVDLQQQWVNLLRSKDEKIRQRAIERLTDMKYKGAHTADEEPRLILDLPRPTPTPDPDR